jgi:YhcH/YjgK/YiaL family protein
MVHDHIKYAKEYFNLRPGIRTALEFLQQADLDALPAGRHAVDGEAVFVLVSDYETRRAEETFWEAHRRHVDVQYVHRGVEQIGVGDLATFQADPYDEAKDLLVAHGGAGRQVEVGPGGFTIFFPHDVHMPGLIAGTVQSVRKLVVKVRL